MSKTERIKMVKAMEYIMRNLNDEEIFYNYWLTTGVGDGDIEYGDLDGGADETLDYYIEDDTFADLMDTFCRTMAKARKSGGLYCDDIVSGYRKDDGTFVCTDEA